MKGWTLKKFTELRSGSPPMDHELLATAPITQ
jgi:hypothetical protein